jgi:very-short-patch-repair endonuclease
MAREPSDLEAEFATRWRQLDGPELVTEYMFHETRDWRFDFAHPATLVAIEIEGGVWGTVGKDGKRRPGRHLQPQGFIEDCKKYNAATADGWALFRFTADMLRDDPITNLTPVMDVIRYRDEDWQ